MNRIALILSLLAVACADYTPPSDGVTEDVAVRQEREMTPLESQKYNSDLEWYLQNKDRIEKIRRESAGEKA